MFGMETKLKLSNSAINCKNKKKLCLFTLSYTKLLYMKNNFRWTKNKVFISHAYYRNRRERKWD